MADSSSLSQSALEIFEAGLDAVRPDRLIGNTIRVIGSELWICDRSFRLNSFSRVVLVGAGKASGAMAAAAVRRLHTECPQLRLSGWINVPDDCQAEAAPVTIHRCRPAGHNLPTQRAVDGTKQIVRIISDLGPEDICICLVSGGGSALLVSPPAEIPLEDKCLVTQLLSANQASIQQLNRVRRQLSQVKGGRLIAGRPDARVVSLILSDVLGDCLELVASGPTVRSSDDSPQTALQVFRDLKIPDSKIPSTVLRYLKSKRDIGVPGIDSSNHSSQLIGNLSLAVNAAAIAARKLGFDIEIEIRDSSNLDANREGQRFAHLIVERPIGSRPFALISGGEPVVSLASSPGRGGRNQQLVLMALQTLLSTPQNLKFDFCLLSAGTDGEDGNTSCAGAWIDRASWQRCQNLRTNPTPYLDRNDAFSFFNQSGGLIDTGLTETNVGDLRVLLICNPRRDKAASS